MLLLGSMPGAESLRQQQYYAHPRNAFWPILCAWLDIDPGLPYTQRCDALTSTGIALWDVLASCRRRGSLDAAIDSRSARANDFASFFGHHRSIEHVACNGRLATSLFARHRAAWPEAPPHAGLPSTSPAHAAMPFERKREIWHDWLREAAA